MSDVTVYLQQKIDAYAFFTGQVKGICDLRRQGWFDSITALERIDDARRELDAKLEFEREEQSALVTVPRI